MALVLRKLFPDVSGHLNSPHLLDGLCSKSSGCPSCICLQEGSRVPAGSPSPGRRATARFLTPRPPPPHLFSSLAFLTLANVSHSETGCLSGAIFLPCLSLSIREQTLSVPPPKHVPRGTQWTYSQCPSAAQLRDPCAPSSPLPGGWADSVACHTPSCSSRLSVHSPSHSCMVCPPLLQPPGPFCPPNL